MGLAEHIVVHVVSRSHLEAACSELDVDVTVLDHADHAADQGHYHLAALEPLVLRVLGVDAHRRIAHYGLRAGCGDYSIVAFLILVDYVAGSLQLLFVLKGGQAVDIIFQVEEMALLLLVDHFFGRKRGEGLGVPVHHTQVTVDVAFAVEVHEDLDDALRASLVHREGRAVPVAGSAQAAQLLEDDAAVLAGPVPGVLEKLLAGELVLLDALLG